MITTALRLASVLLLVLVALAATAIGRPAAAQIPYINALFNEPRYAAIVVDANTGEVLYAKQLWKHGKVTALQMTYPVAERNRWDMALSRMAESLKAAK